MSQEKKCFFSRLVAKDGGEVPFVFHTKTLSCFATPSGSKRGNIKTFSVDSRKRMMLYVNSVDWSAYRFRYHCTISDRVGVTKKVFSKVVRVLRQFGFVGIWRFEMGENNDNPHYHFIIASDKPLSTLEKVLPFDEFQKTKLKDLDCLHRLKRIFTTDLASYIHGFFVKDIVELIERKYLMFYVSKYCSKVNDEVVDRRVWGRFGVPLLCRVETQEISSDMLDSILNIEADNMVASAKSPNKFLYATGIRSARCRFIRYVPSITELVNNSPYIPEKLKNEQSVDESLPHLLRVALEVMGGVYLPLK